MKMMMMMMLIIMIRLCYSTENITPIYYSKWFCLHFTNCASFLTSGAYQKTFYTWYRKYWHFVQAKRQKKPYLVPIFYIWCTILQMMPFYIWCRNRRFTVQYGNIFGRAVRQVQYDVSSFVRVQINPVLYSKTYHNLFILHLINETWFSSVKILFHIYSILYTVQYFIKFYISLKESLSPDALLVSVCF